MNITKKFKNEFTISTESLQSLLVGTHVEISIVQEFEQATIKKEKTFTTTFKKKRPF